MSKSLLGNNGTGALGVGACGEKTGELLEAVGDIILNSWGDAFYFWD